MQNFSKVTTLELLSECCLITTRVIIINNAPQNVATEILVWWRKGQNGINLQANLITLIEQARDGIERGTANVDAWKFGGPRIANLLQDGTRESF